MPSSSAITSGGTSAVAETSVEVGSSSLSEVQSGGAVPMAASGIGMIGESTMGSIDTASVTLASALAPTGSPSAADFVLPGRQLSVLPIGLGIFAGVSFIALIIVGIVTYERKKYRRQFRERRIAEQAQAHLPVARGPGYGTIGAQMREREGVV
ncbi:hypothetical protein BCR35DRAFT_302968 [Leucosporidium creatinivorum]|uniref:Transmembrane protein n=1 Tax=Leucosporidium creatinivorum TaxID=106004 RepID=A0A1Y2FL09_9BASI|nr:hypothetical protein BCR35DRAFT_302968 [Leucosporidium creatinivorum]